MDIPNIIIVKQSVPHAVVTQIQRGPAGSINSVVPPLQLNESNELEIAQYTYQQIALSTVWVITHNLNRLYPNLIVKDNFENTLIGETIAIDINNLQITFSLPVSGTAYLH